MLRTTQRGWKCSCSAPALPFFRCLQDKYPPSDLPQPPEGCRTLAVFELVRRLNEATQTLPRWEPHSLADAPTAAAAAQA